MTLSNQEFFRLIVVLVCAGAFIGSWIVGLVFTYLLLTAKITGTLLRSQADRPFTASLLWFVFWPLVWLDNQITNSRTDSRAKNTTRY